MSATTGLRRAATLLARCRAESQRDAVHGRWLTCCDQGWAPSAASAHPASAPAHAFSTSRGAPADQLPLPAVKDDVEDAVRGEAEELPLGEVPGENLAAAAALLLNQQQASAQEWQQPPSSDTLSSLPLGASLRQEAQVQGRTWAFETGKLARLANGSCLVRCGGTTVLAAATSQSPPWSRRDALSLQFEVDYREKLYAVARIPSTYNKREGNPKEHELLAGRRIGRALRPLFPKGFALDSAVFASVLSADGDTDPGVLAIGAASAALLCSDLPWAGPVAAARVAVLRDGRTVTAPSVEQQEAAELNLLVAATGEGRITMLEADGEQVPEARFIEALRVAVAAAQQLVEPQLQLAAQTGRQTLPTRLAGADPSAAPKVAQLATPAVEAILRDGSLDKLARSAALQKAKEGVLESIRASGAFRTEFARLPGSGCITPSDVDHVFSAVISAVMRRLVIEDGWRCDGRGSIDVRPVHCEVDSVPVVHGSALFTRGETQSLCTATVGRRQEQQKTESLLGGESSKRLFVHYSFPAFAVGDASLHNGMRREMGHSEVAERALLPVIPPTDSFPFTLRLNAETLASAGSSSMAAVCGGALALADAGVPLKGLVAGVSVGLMTDAAWGGESRQLSPMPVQAVGGAGGAVAPAALGRYELLLDQLGMEDQLGDMDLKVAGTHQGITTCQLDVKLQGGVPVEVLEEALLLAARGRTQLLHSMEQALPEKRAAHAPTFGSVKVPDTMLGRVIGAGGSNLKQLEERWGARVDVDDDGTVSIFASSQEGFEAAETRILDLAGESVKDGHVYRGTVTRIMDYGALLELQPSGLRALLHISDISAERVRSIDDVVKMGQSLEVMCVGRDQKGQVRLSRKAVLARHTARQQASQNVARSGGIDADK